MSSIQEQIENALNSAFDVLYLKVVNDSALHKGHVGDDGSGGSVVGFKDSFG